jgi:hypothetical protein
LNKALHCNVSPYELNDGAATPNLAWVCEQSCAAGLDAVRPWTEATPQARPLAAMAGQLRAVYNDPPVAGGDVPPVPPPNRPPAPAGLAPNVTILENNTTNCPGTQQVYSATDGNNVPINWTYTNGTYPCVRVTYYPVTTAAACDFKFYVPKGFATANVRFDISYLVDGVAKKGTVWLDENRVDDFQIAFRMSNVILTQFQDDNGQPYKQAGARTPRTASCRPADAGGPRYRPPQRTHSGPGGAGAERRTPGPFRY